MPTRFLCVMRIQLCQSCWHGGALLQPPSGYMYDLPTPNPSTLLDLRTSGVAREVRAQVWPPIGFTKVWQCAQKQDAYLWRGWFDKEFRQFTWCCLHWLKSIPRSPHLITWIFVFDTECRVNINGRLIYAYFVSLIHFYKCTQHLSQLLEWAANSSATLTSLSALKVVYFCVLLLQILLTWKIPVWERVLVATMPGRFRCYIRFVLLFSLSLYLDTKQGGGDQTTSVSKYYS